MTEIADARIRLHTNVRAYVADVLSPDRVHLYSPEQIASPCIWLGQPATGSIEVGNNRSRLRTITFGVYIVPDGYTLAACALLDELVARVADAIYDLPQTDDNGAFPRSFDIGGPSVRGVVHTAVMTTIANGFCKRPPPPVIPLTTEEARRG